MKRLSQQSPRRKHRSPGQRGHLKRSHVPHESRPREGIVEAEGELWNLLRLLEKVSQALRSKETSLPWKGLPSGILASVGNFSFLRRAFSLKAKLLFRGRVKSSSAVGTALIWRLWFTHDSGLRQQKNSARIVQNDGIILLWFG